MKIKCAGVVNVLHILNMPHPWLRRFMFIIASSNYGVGPASVLSPAAS